MHARVNIFLHVHIDVHAQIDICIYTCMCIDNYIRMYVNRSVCIQSYEYIYLQVFVYKIKFISTNLFCMYTHMYFYIHMSLDYHAYIDTRVCVFLSSKHIAKC